MRSFSTRRGSYLPPGGGFGPMFQNDPQTSGPGKSIKTQHLGTVVGKRGAGISEITGGDTLAHGMNDYGKNSSIRNLVGGGF